ncbi:MAG: hypothetical protein MjAS7_1932 [Metallosphaera javensis (ex Sakai et al. 2022)]|nr:MAG: hypothetical protein MjAS7_1932 [Metallosphaera javensis (ex Sakai et al. 2022)]
MFPLVSWEIELVITIKIPNTIIDIISKMGNRAMEVSYRTNVRMSGTKFPTSPY